MNTKFYRLADIHRHPKCEEDRITGKCKDRAYYLVIRKIKRKLIALHVCKEHLRIDDKVDTEYDYLNEANKKFERKMKEFNKDTSYFD